MQNLMIYAYTCVPFNSGRSDIALAQVGLGNPRNAQAHARSKFAMATFLSLELSLPLLAFKREGDGGGEWRVMTGEEGRERVVERELVSEGEGESVGEWRVMKGEEGGGEAVERMEEAWKMEEVLEGEGVGVGESRVMGGEEEGGGETVERMEEA